MRRALRQNQHDQEAKELIRQIEMNAFTTTSGATTAEDARSGGETERLKIMQARVEKLEDEIVELRDSHQRELIMM